MLTHFANQFCRSLFLLSLAFTCGCATVSEQPTVVNHPPMEAVATPATFPPPLLSVPPHTTSQKNIQAIENNKNEKIPSAVKSSPQVALTAHQENCLPHLDEWKAELAKKSEQTDKKLNELQASLNASQEKMARMETEQAHSKTEIERLKNQVDFYRREVTRLEQLMETQHAADLVILDSLTNQLGGLLDRTKRSHAY